MALPQGITSDLCPFCISDDPRELTARVLGDCELYEELGRGGMGVVWRGRQRGLEREVAVKTLPGGDLATAEARERFRTEAQATARLHHPNIVTVYAVGEEDGMPYIVMELILGRPLGVYITNDNGISHQQAAQWIQQAAEAVEHAHQQGVLHRDLKPANMIVETETLRLKLTDFGLAKILGADVSATFTRQAAGSPAYMPPEQARTGLSTTRSDVYGLGAVLYAMLTGRAPFHSESLASMLAQVERDEPVRPSQLTPNIPQDLETICLKCLEKDPTQRYASAQELWEDINHFLQGRPVRARPISSAARAMRWARRHPWPAASLVLSLGLVATVISFLLWRVRQDQQHAAALQVEQRATQEALITAKIEEARALIDLAAPHSQAQALGIIQKTLTLHLSPHSRAQLRDAAISALSLPSAEVRALKGEGVACSDWTWAASDLARGRWALAQHYLGPVHIRQIESAADSHTIDVTPHEMTALIGFSPGGRWLAMRHGEQLGVWDTMPESERPLAMLVTPWAGGRRFNVTKQAFTPDDQGLLWIDGDDVVLTSLPSGQEQQRWHGGAGDYHAAESIALDSTGQWCAVALARRPTVQLRRFPAGVLELQYDGFFSQPLTSIALSSGAEQIAGGDGTGQLVIWRRSELVGPTHRFHQQRAPFYGLRFSPDSRLLSSTCEDGTSTLWDALLGRHLVSLPMEMGVGSFSLDQQSWGVGTSAGQLSIAHYRPSEVLQSFRPPAPPGLPQTFTQLPDGRSLLCLGGDGIVQCQLPDGRALRTWSFQRPSSLLAELGRDSFLVAGAGGVARLFLSDDRAPQQLASGSRWGCGSLCRSADGQWLGFTETECARGVVWPSTQSGLQSVRSIADAKALPSTMVLSPDGALAALGDVNAARLRICNVSDGNLLRELPLPARHALAWSPNGRWLAASGSQAALWDTATWASLPLPSLAENHAPAGGCAFNASSKLLAYVVGNASVALIHPETRVLLATLHSPRVKQIYKIEFSPDEQWLTAAAEAGEIYQWDLTTLRQRLAWLNVNTILE